MRRRRPWTARRKWRSGLLRRLARRGSASPRRGRRSVLGVQRDGQWRGRYSPENVEFWTGKRKDDGAARRRGRPESAARRWSPTPRPTTGRFSGSLTSRQSTSFMPANISAKLPTVATDWYDHATLRDARRRQGRHYLRDKATTKTAVAVLKREVLPQAQAPPTRASRPGAARSGVVRQQGAGQPAHEAGALERRRRPERPRLQGVAGPLRRRLATETHGANDSLNAA